MFRTTLKGLLAHKLRLFTTALAVTLGVSFMVGTLVLTDTITTTFDKLFADVFQGTDAVVRGKAVFDGPQNTGQQRPRVDAALVDRLRNVKGVAISEGSAFGYARLVDKNGNAMGNPSAGAPTIGTNWTDTKQLNSFRLVEGQPPRAPDEIAIDKKSSKDGNLRVGDTATVLVQGPPQTLRITGIVKFGGAESPGGATIVMFTTEAAQRLVSEPGKFDDISFVAKKGVSQTELVRNLSAAIPAGTEAVTGKQILKENQDAMRKGLAFFTTFMLVFAVVALLVGGFMIFNTFSITVAQRTRENGLLRALGASRRQVLSSVIVEAAAVGLLASVVGLAAGVTIAAGLKALLQTLGFDMPAGPIVFAPRTAAVGLIAGVGVTVLSALSPARKAGKVPPVAAMTQEIAGSTGYGSKERVMVGFGVLGAGVATLMVGLLSPIGHRVAVVGLGALLVFFGVSILGRTISLPLSRVLGWPLPLLRGMSGTLARENAMRNPKRTAASASALMIGVGLVSFIAIFASSTKASTNAIIDRAFTGDYAVESGASTTGGLDPGLAKRMNRLPEIAAATGLRQGAAKIAGKVVTIVAVDPATSASIYDVRPRQGAVADLGRDGLAVYRNVAEARHFHIGDRVPVVFRDTGEQELRVVLIYDENRPAGDYFIGIPAYEANFANQYDSQVFAKKAPGVSTANGLAAVKRLARAYPGSTVLDRAGFKRQLAKPVDQLLVLVYALLTLAIIIALLGIANTLTLSILERTRELGVMRAVGMTRWQLRSTIRWESVIIAVQGAILGLAIGVFFGWAMVRALKSQGIGVLSLPIGTLITVVVLAAVAGVVAAILPGRRAAKLDVLRAVTLQ